MLDIYRPCINIYIILVIINVSDQIDAEFFSYCISHPLTSRGGQWGYIDYMILYDIRLYI